MNGQCVDPKTRLPDAPPPEKKSDDGVTVTIHDVGEPAYDDDATGWSMAAGVIGIVSAALVLTLSIGSELSKEDRIPSLPLGAAATVLVAAMGPVTAAGGGSARHGGATGLKGLRIVGWIAYGVSLVGALYLLILGASDTEPFGGLITTTGVVGAASLTFFGIDAFVSHSEAAEGTLSSVPALVPALGMARDNGGGAIPSFGLAARF